MRERVLKAIYKKIDENPEDERLQRQVTLLNKASICTIDSFCLDVVRNNFFEIDISQNFRIADTTEIEILQQDVLEELFEEKYESKDENFAKLINTYTGYRDDTPLKELILTIYKYIQSNPYPEKWLDEKIEMFNFNLEECKDFSQTNWGKILLKQIKEVVDDGIIQLKPEVQKLSECDDLKKSYEFLRGNLNQLELLQANLDTWDKAYTIYATMDFGKWTMDRNVKLDEKVNAQKVREKVISTLKSSAEKVLIMDSNEAYQDIINMYDILKKLEGLILDFSQIFAKRKKEKNMVDFSDVEHFALKILLDENGNPTEIAKKYQSKFDEIAIDEYQDSNLVQEYILTSVSKGNNIFMVGDVKQSIYKFRQARPELFLNKYEKYKLKGNDLSNGQKIQLFKNFRSRSNILDVTNMIFENIMSKSLGDILYDETEFLNLGADYKNPETDLINYAGKTELNIIDLKDEEINVFKDSEEDDELPSGAERIEDVVLEARFVANKIKSFLNSGYMVFDKKTNEYRNVTYKDIVVLLRATSVTAPIYENEIAKLSFPVFSDVSSEYLESLEIQTIMSVLKVVDNPMQDIPLVTVLRSTIGGFSDNDLVEIRLKNKNQPFYKSLKEYDGDDKLKTKINIFLENVKRWQSQEKYMALDELIWQIYLDTGFYNYVTLLPNGALRQANLKMLFERAKQYESASFKGLFNFISFIDKLHTSSGDLSSAKLIGENENVIRIMSIHKSKGLEFPVVFLCGTGKQFNMQDLNKNILLHQDIGIGPKYINTERSIEYNTLAKEAIKIQSKVEALSEEMRVLYVALTRAKEKLIITGISKDVEKSFNEKQDLIEIYKIEGKSKINESVLKKYKTYLDWITLVYLADKEKAKEYIDIEIHKKKDLLKQFEKKSDKSEEKDIFKELDSRAKNVKKEDLEEFKKQIFWVYGYIDSIATPTKTSVTKIKELENEDDAIVSLEELSNKQEFKQEIAKPKFLNEEQKISSAQKGTLMHLCFQRLDESKNYTMEQIKEFVQNLVNRNIITKQESDAINITKLYEYTKSNLWQELKNAKEVHKEQPFYVNLKSQDVYGNSSNDNILVQGIIDLYYINSKGEIILVDYKTDRINNGEEQKLIEKYSKQLEIYQKALEQSLQKNVSRKYIYSVTLGKEIMI